MKVEILDAAERDLIDGFHFYEDQASGLGDYFLNSLFSDIDSLTLYAGIHARFFGYYRALSKRFPFAIYYLVDGNVARVQAVLDCRQDPNSMIDRLK